MIRVLAVALFAAVASTLAFAAEKPSFDCATAKTAREKTVCRVPRLAAADRALAAAYGDARRRLSREVGEALRVDQKRFLELLDNGFDAEIWFKGSVPDDARVADADLRRVLAAEPEKITDLAAVIDGRTAMLRDLRQDRPGFVGRWANADATLTIAAAVDGAHAVTYHDPSYGWPKYECAFEASARPDGAGLVARFTDGPVFAEEGLQFGRAGTTRNGPFLDLVETLDESRTGDDREVWICPHSPEVKGRFFAVGGR